METIELKFLLKLLGFPDYQASITKLNPNSTTKESDKQSIARKLRDRGFLECSYDFELVKISEAGKALLKLERSHLPIPDEEFAVLQTLTPKAVRPNATIAPEILHSLEARGLATATKKKIKEIKLTAQGQAYLREEYTPKKGFQPVLSMEMLQNYLALIRKSSKQEPAHAPTDQAIATPMQLDKDAILEAIVQLDRELETENYLPIFHLRRKLQPPLTKEECDRILIQLEAENRIDLSSLAEPRDYTSEQLEAGIPQIGGGSLFFVSLR